MTSEAAEAVHTALGRFASQRTPPQCLLLAVSGGPDSLALLLAVAELYADRRDAVRVATVDHRLRPEAAGEAAYVAALCRDLGLPHRTLVWRDAHEAAGNLMGAAREARYKLLADEARRVGADVVLTAHHADDQLETHLLAKARGASGASLAGMRPWRDLEPGIVLLRPFLPVSKQALVRCVEKAGLHPAMDPSNRDEQYARVRLRGELARGVHDRDALARALADATALRDGDDRRTEDAIRLACAEERLALDAKGALTFAPGENDSILWARLLTAVGGGAGAPPRQAVDRLAERFRRLDATAATLGGCRVEKRKGTLRFLREFGRSGPSGLDAGQASHLCFDRRIDLERPMPEAACRIEAVGQLGSGNLAERTLPVCLDDRGSVLAAHPVLSHRFVHAEVLAANWRIGWRIWADLPGQTPERLTAEPQNAANPLKAVGKDLAATYLRGRVKVRAP